MYDKIEIIFINFSNTQDIFTFFKKKVKKLRLEQQEQELQEKVQQNIKLQEEAALLANAEPPEEFELRKSPLPGDKPDKSPSKLVDPTSQLPRTLLLGNQPSKALYDDDCDEKRVDLFEEEEEAEEEAEAEEDEECKDDFNEVDQENDVNMSNNSGMSGNQESVGDEEADDEVRDD